jgi:hypothetical protein
LHGRFLQQDTILGDSLGQHYLFCGQNAVVRVDSNGEAWNEASGSRQVGDALRSEAAFLRNRIKEADAWWRPKGKEIKGYEKRLEEIGQLLKNYDWQIARLPEADPDAQRLHDSTDENSLLEQWADFQAGVGDSLTLDLTSLIRSYFEIGNVNKCGKAYKVGEYTEVAAVSNAGMIRSRVASYTMTRGLAYLKSSEKLNSVYDAMNRRTNSNRLRTWQPTSTTMR